MNFGILYIHNSLLSKAFNIEGRNCLYIKNVNTKNRKLPKSLLSKISRYQSLIIDFINDRDNLRLASLINLVDKKTEINIYINNSLLNYDDYKSMNYNVKESFLIKHPSYDLRNDIHYKFFNNLLKNMKIYLIQKIFHTTYKQCKIEVFSKKSFHHLLLLSKEFYNLIKFNSIESKLIRKIAFESNCITSKKTLNINLKKVLLFISHLNSGGAERQFVNLAIVLKNDGFDVCVCFLNNTIEPFAPYIKKLKENKVIIISNELDYFIDKNHFQIMSKLPSYVRKWTFNAYNAINNFRPDIVHSFMDWGNIMTILAGTILEHNNINLSFRCTSPNNYEKNKFWFKKYYKLAIYHKGIKFSGNSIRGNNDYKKWLNLKSKNIHYTPNIRTDTIVLKGRNTSLQKINEDYPDFNLSMNDFIIGGVFRLDEQKCPLLFLKVLHKLKAIGMNFKSIIVGDGPLRSKCKKQTEELSLKNQVNFVGKQNDISTYYSIFDILMLTSSHEGTPNVLIEAQSLGIPCVTTNAGASSEIVINEHTGRVVNVNDLNALVKSCVHLMKNPQNLNSLSKNALQRSNKLYSPGSGLESIKSLYYSNK